MSPEEWGNLPWYESKSLLEGLEAEGIIGDGTGNGSTAPTGASPDGLAVDLAMGGPLPQGMQTRRAG